MARVSLAAILAALVIGLTPYSVGSGEYTAEQFSALPDEQRWSMVEQGYELPLPPEGYTWAEDLTLVPLSVVAEGKSDQRIIRAEDQLLACSEWELASTINDAHSWIANDPRGADEHALQLLADNAEAMAKRVCPQ